MEKFPYEMRDIKPCNEDEYEFKDKVAIAPDHEKHKIIYNKLKNRYGYILNKNNLEDDSFYAPYLMYKIGKKLGIKVHDTELGVVLHQNMDKNTYAESFSEASIVYDNSLIDEMHEILGSRISQISQDEILRIYLNENPISAQKRNEQIKGNALPQTIDDYVESNLYYLITRGNKPRQEYSRSEIDSIKQELVDKLLFGLKFGTSSNSYITLINDKNPSLSPYYLSHQKMFSLNVREEWIKEQLEKDDNNFSEIIEAEYKAQYGVIPNTYAPKSGEVIKYIFDKYPEQAEKSYKKLSSFSIQDLNKELASCIRMSESHKKFATRVFDIKNREFENAYEEHMRTKNR